MAIAGHVSRQMLEHYSHVRLELKRKALKALQTRSANPLGKADGYDTNSDTRHTSGDSEEDTSCRNEWSALEDDFRTLLLSPAPIAQTLEPESSVAS
jgi:hypothetical protein